MLDTIDPLLGCKRNDFLDSEVAQAQKPIPLSILGKLVKAIKTITGRRTEATAQAEAKELQALATIYGLNPDPKKTTLSQARERHATQWVGDEPHRFTRIEEAGAFAKKLGLNVTPLALYTGTIPAMREKDRLKDVKAQHELAVKLGAHTVDANINTEALAAETCRLNRISEARRDYTRKMTELLEAEKLANPRSKRRMPDPATIIPASMTLEEITAFLKKLGR